MCGMRCVAPRLICVLVAAGLCAFSARAVTLLPAPAAGVALPAAHGVVDGVTIDIGLADDARVASERMPALGFYALGVAVMPLAAVDPSVALGWPLLMVFAAPWQAVFNARLDTLAGAFAAVPLPQATLAALREQWPAGAVDGTAALTVGIRAFGLVTRSGRPLEAFGEAEPLCLALHAQIDVQRAGRRGSPMTVAIGTGERAPDLPPASCATLSRWAADDGLRLRRALAELAELLAAMALRQWDGAP